jgi:hypothetical protein
LKRQDFLCSFYSRILFLLSDAGLTNKNQAIEIIDESFRNEILSNQDLFSEYDGKQRK